MINIKFKALSILMSGLQDPYGTSLNKSVMNLMRDKTADKYHRYCAVNDYEVDLVSLAEYMRQETMIINQKGSLRSKKDKKSKKSSVGVVEYPFTTYLASHITDLIHFFFCHWIHGDRQVDVPQ